MKLYVRGAAIDWPAVDRGYAHRKVALPTYPFQHQRCWIEPLLSAESQSEAQHGFAQWLLSSDLEHLTDLVTDRGEFATQERATINKVLATLAAERLAQQAADEVASMLYEVTWEQQPRSVSLTPPAAPGRWLIVADACEVGQALAVRLTALGERVELLATGAEVSTAAGAVGPPLRGVIHLSSLASRLPTDLADLLASRSVILVLPYRWFVV